MRIRRLLAGLDGVRAAVRLAQVRNPDYEVAGLLALAVVAGFDVKAEGCVW